MNKRTIIAISMILGLQAQILQASANSETESRQIIEFVQTQVDIFSVDGNERLGRIDTDALIMPMPIVNTLSGGYYVIEVDGETRAVRKRSVRTDRVYKLVSGCSNHLSGSKTGTSRGLGNGEC